VATHEEALIEARERAEYTFTLETEGLLEESATAAAISVVDQDGTAMIVEVGAGPNGVFASVAGFANEEPAELHVFASDNTAMLIVDKEE
jgi:ABC-type thiamine transport system ATPase subunit